jgi:hypothetical protein
MRWGTDSVAPAARTQQLIVQRVGNEVLAYDTRTDEAHQLTPLAAAVFEGCDGRATVDEIAAAASDRLGEPVGIEAVGEALDQLADRGLLGEAGGLSRREAMRKVALVGAGAAASVPLVKSIVAPTPAQALATVPCKPDGQPCTLPAECCSGDCTGNVCVSF